MTGNALIMYEAKHPLILPYRHHATDLIISQYHQETGHLGQEYVLSNLNQFYWMIKARSAVWRVISSCFHCKKTWWSAWAAVNGQPTKGRTDVWRSAIHQCRRRLLWTLLLRLFCRMRNRSLVSEHEFTCLVDWSVDQSILPWVVNFCLYFR